MSYPLFFAEYQTNDGDDGNVPSNAWTTDAGVDMVTDAGTFIIFT